MNRKLFVASLPWGVDDIELRDIFSKYGAVLSATVIRNRDTGNSRGFGFVEMATEADAQAAVQGLHEGYYGGRKIIVNVAKPSTGRYLAKPQNPRQNSH